MSVRPSDIGESEKIVAEVIRCYTGSIMKSRFLRENFLVAGILSLVLVIAFYDIVFLGKTFKVSTTVSQALPYGPYQQLSNKPGTIPVNGQDSAIMEEPIYEFIKQNLRRGIFPLWNPHQACGYPLIAMIEVGIFFPLSIIMYLLPQMYAWDILIFSRFFFAGLFTFWFMRTLGFKRIPALGSGIVFMLSGPMVLLQYWSVNVDIIAPLLLLCLERLIRKPRIQNACFTAGAVALTFLGGHPEHIFFVNVFAFLYFCFRVFTYKPAVSLKKAWGYLGLSYIFGLGLSAIVLFPFIYNFVFEFWHAHPQGVGLSTGEIKERVLSIILPYFFQKESLTYDFTFAGWWGGYIGLLPAGLGFLSLFRRQKNGLNYFFGISAFLIIAKCYSVPIINWIGYLPLFSACRYYIHTPHLAAFAVAIIAGMGIRAVMIDRGLFRKGLWFSVIVLLITGGYLFCFRNAPHFSISIQSSLLALGILLVLLAVLFAKDKQWLGARLAAFILVVLLIAELSLYIPRERARRYDSFAKVPYIELIKASPERVRCYGLVGTLYPNTATAYETDDLGVFMGLLPKRFVYFVNHFIVQNRFRQNLAVPALRSSPTNILSVENPFTDLLNLQIIAVSYLPYFEVLLSKPFYSGEVDLYKKNGAFPRSFIVHRAIFLSGEDRSMLFKTLEAIQDKLREIVVIEHAPIADIEKVFVSTPIVDNSKSHITKYTANEVVIEADLENPGFLVLSDAFHPDWKAFIDGKETEIFATDYLLRSVFAGAGKHEVRFVFRPMNFYWGIFVSLLSLMVLIALWIREKMKR